MKDKAQTYELIEKYIDGIASNDEIEEYERRLAHDRVFANDVHSYLALKKGFSNYAKRELLKKQLNKAHEEMVKTTSQNNIKSMFKSWKPMLAAASMALFFSTITYLFMNTFNQNMDQRSHYKALKKDIENVKKSQHQLWATVNAEDTESESMSGGSGIAIDQSGFILTDYHVIQDAKRVFVANKTYGKWSAKVIYTNPKLDIAILKINENTFKKFNSIPYPLYTKKMALGEKVFTLGFPNKDIVFGEGYISSKNGYEGDTLAYQVSIPVNPGNSGGPLFDENGNLVGIVNGKHTENEGAGFATKAFEIAQNLQSVSDSLQFKLPKYNTLKIKNKTRLIEKIEPFVFSVEVGK